MGLKHEVCRWLNVNETKKRDSDGFPTLSVFRLDRNKSAFHQILKEEDSQSCYCPWVLD